MSPRVAGVELLGHEYRILVLEAVVDLLMSRIPIAGPVVSVSELGDIRKRALAVLQLKYPNAKIEPESWA